MELFDLKKIIFDLFILFSIAGRGGGTCCPTSSKKVKSVLFLCAVLFNTFSHIGSRNIESQNFGHDYFLLVDGDQLVLPLLLLLLLLLFRFVFVSRNLEF